MEVENITEYFKKNAQSFKKRLQEETEASEKIKNSISSERDAYTELLSLFTSAVEGLDTSNIVLEEEGVELKRVINGRQLVLPSKSLTITWLDKKSILLTPKESGEKYEVEVKFNGANLNTFHIFYNEDDKKWYITLSINSLTSKDSNYTTQINDDVIHSILNIFNTY